MSVTSLLSRRSVQALLAVGLVAAVVGLALFQPWKLVVDETVDEAAPPGVADAAAPAGAPSPAVTPPAGTLSPAPGRTTAGPASVLLAPGRFLSHEHRTTGTVRVVGLPDGRRCCGSRTSTPPTARTSCRG